VKKVAVAAVLCATLSSTAFALKLEGGLLYGLRTMSNATIKDPYGNGGIFYPYLALEIVKSVIIGVGYDIGYSRSANMGIFDERTTLKIEGYEAFLCLQPRFGSLEPRLKIGVANYSYKQTVDSRYLDNFKVEQTKTTFTVGAGLKIYVLKNFFLTGEVIYIPLKVKPIEDEVDLTGMRILGGLGFRL